MYLRVFGVGWGEWELTIESQILENMIKSTGNELIGYVHYNNETIPAKLKINTAIKIYMDFFFSGLSNFSNLNSTKKTIPIKAKARIIYFNIKTN